MKTAAQLVQEKKLSKPRNPLVAQALFKKAGAHQASRKTDRQQGKKALRQAFDEGFSDCSGHTGRPQKSSAWMVSAGDLFFERFRDPSAPFPEDFLGAQALDTRVLGARRKNQITRSVLEGLMAVKGARW